MNVENAINELGNAMMLNILITLGCLVILIVISWVLDGMRRKLNKIADDVYDANTKLEIMDKQQEWDGKVLRDVQDIVSSKKAKCKKKG